LRCKTNAKARFGKSVKRGAYLSHRLCGLAAIVRQNWLRSQLQSAKRQSKTMAGEIEQLNVLTPDSPAALLLRAIAEYEREWASIEVWPYLSYTDAEIDDALNLIY